MLVRILSGNKKGQLTHVPREQLVDLLIALGFIEPAAPPQPAVVRPPKGWVIQRGGEYGDKLFLVHHDGHGGTMRYSDAPGPTRVHFWNEEKEMDDYKWVPSDCPAELIAQFRAMGGGQKDLFSDADAGDAYRQRLARKQFEVDEQAKQVHGALHGLKG